MTLKAPRKSVIKRFRGRFGEVCPIDKPWQFYRHKGYAGRKLIFAVGETRSRKPAFTKLEATFTDARRQAEAVLGKCQEHVAAAVPAYQPEAPATRPMGEQLFDARGRPFHILFGLFECPDGFHASRWLGLDFQTQPTFTPGYDEDGQMLLSKGFPEEREYWKHRIRTRQAMGSQTLSWRLRPSFKERFRSDHGLFPHTELGPHVPKPDQWNRWYTINIFNPEIQDYAHWHFEQYAKLLKHNPLSLFFEYAGEPTFYTHADGVSCVYGYSKSAKEGFRALLRGKFGAIGKLNQAWGRTYQDFSDVEPPTHEALAAMKPEDLPLIYEFRRFRKMAVHKYFSTIYDACKRSCAKPVLISGARSYVNGNSLDAFDTYRLARDTVDVVCHHDYYAGSYRHYATQNYYYSVTRYLDDKPRGNLEFYMAYPESNHFKWPNDDSRVLFNRSLSNLWRCLAWDEKLICVWTWHTNRTMSYHSGLTLSAINYGAVPLMRSKIRGGIEDVIFKTRIVPSKIGLLAPYHGTMVCQPDAQMAREGTYLHRFLAADNYDYLCVPEEFVLDGTESLEHYRALIAPYTLWAPQATQEKLLRWVSEGGLLISIGPFGLWDEYGRPNRTLIDRSFGKITIDLRKEKGLYCASYPYDEVSRSTKAEVETVLPYTEKKQPNLISAAHGRGRIYLTPDPSIIDVATTAKKAIRKVLDDAIGIRTAWSQDRLLELVTRQERESSVRYLLAVNRSVTKPAEDIVVVRGEYAQPVDVCVSGGVPIQTERLAGASTFRLRLGPGEGTCIKLGAFREAETDRKAVAEFLSEKSGRKKEAVLAELAKIRLGGGPRSYGRAMTCKNVALRFLAQSKYQEALEFARQAAAFSQAPPSAPTSDLVSVPYTDRAPKIDGDVTDWQSAEWRRFGTARMKCRWDESDLYFLVELKDNHIRNEGTAGQLWNGDCLEVFLDILNQGGSRVHGTMDFQYIFTPDGLSQLVHKGGTRISATQAVGRRTKEGYLVEAAISHRETSLHPLPGYVLAFNIRQLDFGVKEGRFRYVGGAIFVDTGYNPARNTYGWAKLMLSGGPAADQSGLVQYVRDRNVIRVSGQGTTLATVCRQVADPSVIRLTKGGVFLGADIEVADGAELVLPAKLVKMSRRTEACRLLPGDGATLLLAGNAVLEDVELARKWHFRSDGKHSLTGRKTITLTARDKKGNPIVNTDVVIRVTGRANEREVLEGDYRLDARGRTAIVLPAWTLEVEGERAKFVHRRYDINVDDYNFTASYTLPNVDVLTVTELAVTFGIHRGTK